MSTTSANKYISHQKASSKKGIKKRRTFDVNNFVVAPPNVVYSAQAGMNSILQRKLKGYMKKAGASVISDKTVNKPTNETASSNITTVHMVNSNHMITQLSPQQEAYSKWSVINKFLNNGFDGERIHKSDQRIIDQFENLPNEEQKAEIDRLKSLAFTFSD